MTTWYDPHAGDARLASFQRLVNLPPAYRWLNCPEEVYECYRDHGNREQCIARELQASGHYQTDPTPMDHILYDAACIERAVKAWNKQNQQKGGDANVHLV